MRVEPHDGVSALIEGTAESLHPSIRRGPSEMNQGEGPHQALSLPGHLILGSRAGELQPPPPPPTSLQELE